MGRRRSVSEDKNSMTPPTPKDEPGWLPILLDMGRNPFYEDQQIIPSINDGTWKAVADYVAQLRAERDALKAERDEWETSSTNWQADCRVAQSRLAAAERDAKRYSVLKAFDGVKVGMTYDGNSGETTFIASTELDAWCDDAALTPTDIPDA
jgi:hypothetical protein